MDKIYTIAGALAGLTAVIFGAFGAHSLRSHISPENLAVWEKGVQYQFYHALALLICGLLLRNQPSQLLSWACLCFATGIICFSGSLYLLSLRELISIPVKIMGPITPLGGLLFIAGWSLLLLHFVRVGKL